MRTEDLERRLGKRLRALRIQRNLTQVELADAANVSLGAIKRLERGLGSTTTTLVSVVRALGQEGWIDTLGPGPAPFNPLEILDARDNRDKRRATSSGAPRVRRRRSAAR
ncbi:MAG TPA: helix-turn-helix transcriptional regulator [Acidimicrobiales bacterium]|jgi:transcriptional regulator with XRE-family HTH domain|nr:helix-turn-helix transcriptional regulator [Acidimicrobiales bacterium]